MSATNENRPCRLSVAIVARDEAERLPAAIRSAKSVADEIVVLDTGSTDETPQIAARLGARVVHAVWRDDFSAARNELIRHLQGDWVLWLDAGERLDESDAAALRAKLDADVAPSRAYLLMIDVPPQQVDGHAEQVAQPRLLPRSSEIRFEGRVRETVLPSLSRAGIKLELSPWRLHRSADEHEAARQRRKYQRNLKLAKLEYDQGIRTPRVLLTLGDVATALGDWSEARSYYRQAIQAAESGSTEMLEGYYGLLTAFADAPEDHEQQLAACVEATGVFSFDAQLLCAMGSYLQSRGRMDLASRSYEAAHRCGQIDPQTWHLVEISEVASLCLAVSLDLLAKADQAEAALIDALERHPSAEKLRRHLIELLIRKGDEDGALQQAKRMPAAQLGQEALRSAVRGACQASKRNWIPAMSYLETAYRAGCRDPLCLRWLAVCVMATGNVLDAEPVLRQWEKIEPSNAELRRYLDLVRDEQPAADQPPPAAIDPSIDHQRRAAEETIRETSPVERNDEVHDTDEAAMLRNLRIDSANNPLDGAIHFRLGSTYRDKGDDHAAEQVWRNYLSRCPSEPRVARALSELLLEQDRLAEAIELVAHTGGDVESEPLAELLAGIRAAREGKWQTALEHLEKSRAAGYDRPVLFAQLADCLIVMGRQREAEGLLRDLLSMQPDNPVNYERLARFLTQNGQPEEARALRRKAQQLSTHYRPHARQSFAATSS